MRDLSIVVPVFNNRESLSPLTKELVESTSERLREIVYVNDGSKDDSLNVLEKLAEQHDFVKVINQPNQGQQKAIQNGLRSVQGELIVVMDADLQDNPTYINAMTTFYRTHGCTCFVRRKGTYQGMGKMLTSTIFKTILWMTSSLHYKAGSYYLLDKITLNKALNLSEKCKNVYMTVIVAHASETIGYVQANRTKSLRTSYNFQKRLKAAFSAISCSFECLLVKFH